MTSSEPKRRITIVLEVNPDAEDDLPIEEAIRWSLEGSGCAAIDPEHGERIVSITETTLDHREARIRAYEERYQTTCCRQCGGEIDSEGWCPDYCLEGE